MFNEDEPLFRPRPFGFASEELLTNVLRTEINAVTQLLAKYPELRNLFDVPEASIPERKTCFALLAHRKLIEIIHETFLSLHTEPPSLADEGSNALKSTQSLFSGDAPAWVLEMNEVVERLPSYIYVALPEPLQTGWVDENNSAQVESIKSAARTLSSLEQFQELTGRVILEQSRRLERRWSVAVVQPETPNGRKGRRKRDRRQMIRDKLIFEIDDVAETPNEFLRLMDERKVKPQPTWTEWPDSWVQAYKNPRLRSLIHKDKSRALSRARAGRNK